MDRGGDDGGDDGPVEIGESVDATCGGVEESRTRFYAAEEGCAEKRKLVLSPIGCDENLKKLKEDEPSSLEYFNKLLAKLERQIAEQVNVKKGTKESMTVVSKYFLQLKESLSRKLEHNSEREAIKKEEELSKFGHIVENPRTMAETT